MTLRIYTRTGDKGTTALIGGVRVPKNNVRIEAYGTVDELNSWLGVVSSDSEISNTILEKIIEIQDRLFTLGSLLACAPDKEIKMPLPQLSDEDIKNLETWIDNLEEQLPPLKSFVLPGGSQLSSFIHVARCVCRRAERICVDMQENNEPVPALAIQYLNRLSDFLFVLARYVLHQQGGEDRAWQPRV